ncbi:unnamed protein product [Vitrella brassicaformis CCMP3155]|uniref:Uncharacterized protein n=1 Tax=Vitrella brassicaformis (strain CCMP3155) TaxID=1169540 RepID=A0A0G4GE29_VITBC|nr:unnamed protein product [Vitrella brassicaformis CCMP3155]|eukprot:CEM27580.1 unnamed protein product [Vitrella brassicaformis CCMP3155]
MEPPAQPPEGQAQTPPEGTASAETPISHPPSAPFPVAARGRTATASRSPPLWRGEAPAQMPLPPAAAAAQPTRAEAANWRGRLEAARWEASSLTNDLQALHNSHASRQRELEAARRENQMLLEMRAEREARGEEGTPSAAMSEDERQQVETLFAEQQRLRQCIQAQQDEMSALQRENRYLSDLKARTTRQFTSLLTANFNLRMAEQSWAVHRATLEQQTEEAQRYRQDLETHNVALQQRTTDLDALLPRLAAERDMLREQTSALQERQAQAEEREASRDVSPTTAPPAARPPLVEPPARPPVVAESPVLSPPPPAVQRPPPPPLASRLPPSSRLFVEPQTPPRPLPTPSPLAFRPPMAPQPPIPIPPILEESPLRVVSPRRPLTAVVEPPPSSPRSPSSRDVHVVIPPHPFVPGVTAEAIEGEAEEGKGSEGSGGEGERAREEGRGPRPLSGYVARLNVFLLNVCRLRKKERPMQFEIIDNENQRHPQFKATVSFPPMPSLPPTSGTWQPNKMQAKEEASRRALEVMESLRPQLAAMSGDPDAPSSSSAPPSSSVPRRVSVESPSSSGASTDKSSPPIPQAAPSVSHPPRPPSDTRPELTTQGSVASSATEGSGIAASSSTTPSPAPTPVQQQAAPIGAVGFFDTTSAEARQVPVRPQPPGRASSLPVPGPRGPRYYQQMTDPTFWKSEGQGGDK